MAKFEDSTFGFLESEPEIRKFLTLADYRILTEAQSDQTARLPEFDYILFGIKV